ncbi:hypothetical protein [Aliiroseovarius marinus]|uniref:hypothetical protein n=1 Tax=Aliiroseovarius marinus TaxID=2500159 RepID=UPI003D7E000B
MKKLFFLLLLLPLAACFDAEMKLVVHDDDTATVKSVITMGPEAYQMAAASGDDPCEDGVGTVLDDGGYQCVTEETDTIDNLIAKLNEEADAAGDDGMSPAQSAKIERLENGDLRVSFDLAELKQAAAESGMEPAMIAMMQQAFEGRAITLSIEGEIIESNGATTAGGDRSQLRLELAKILMQDPSVPDSFVTIVRP